LTNFIIEHQCPQCGAPAELEETDRLFHCGFCKVTSYLSTPDFFRYTLPHNAPSGKEIIYFPYWRFKGMLFSCTPEGIENRFLDVSRQARRSGHFPINMGFRGQTQKLHFATTVNHGTFIKPDIAFTEALSLWQEQYSAGLAKPILHQDQIGETISLLYAPFYLDQKVMDAVLNEAFSASSVAEIPADELTADTPNWPINFLATLCPQCGWDLQGQRDSLALNCTNCDTVWWAKKGRLTQLKTAHVAEKGDDWVYLPFWRIQADVSHIQLKSYADLVQVANLPKVVQPGWDQQPFSFWSPAFKVRPQKFLKLATHITINQPGQHLAAGNPKGRMQAINLPLQEAIESLKLNLANFMKPHQRMVQHLPQIEIQPRRFRLVYIPFQEGHHELIHPGLQLAISKNTLAQARNL
jgi:hypothetical protein